MFCNNQDAGLVNLAYKVDDVRGELDSNRPLPFRQTPSLTKMITSVSVASMIAAARYRYFICFLSASHILHTSHLKMFGSILSDTYLQNPLQK